MFREIAKLSWGRHKKDLDAMRKDLSHKEWRQEHWKDTADEAEQRCYEFRKMAIAMLVVVVMLAIVVAGTAWIAFEVAWAAIEMIGD